MSKNIPTQQEIINGLTESNDQLKEQIQEMQLLLDQANEKLKVNLPDVIPVDTEPSCKTCRWELIIGRPCYKCKRYYENNPDLYEAQ